MRMAVMCLLHLIFINIDSHLYLSVIVLILQLNGRINSFKLIQHTAAMLHSLLMCQTSSEM